MASLEVGEAAGSSAWRWMEMRILVMKIGIDLWKNISLHDEEFGKRHGYGHVS